MSAANRKKSPVPAWRKFWTQKSPVLKFLGGFLLFMLLFYLFYYSALYQNVLSDPIERVQAQLSGALLRLLGYQAVVNDDAILGNGFSVQIAKGCDGVEPLFMLLGGILVFPIAWRLKWPGLLAGFLTLTVLNILRIVGLFLAGIHIPAAFDFLHLHGGFVIFTLITILLWMVWANWAMQKSRPAAT